MEARQATFDDLYEVAEMYEEGLIELGVLRINKDSIMQEVITSYYQAPCFLLEDCGSIKGIAGLTISRSSHNGVASVTDYMFYIQPEYRNLSNLGVLVKLTKTFAKENAMPLKLDLIVDNDLKRKTRLLEMHGLNIRYVSGVYNEEVING